MKRTKISVIIILYNGRHYLPDCLYSLRQQTLKPYQIIIVDNHSRDDSIHYIKENYPEVVLIENKKNLGFAQGNNIGISEALKNNPDYIYLLNQDTVCDKNCLQELSKMVETSKQNVFAYQSLILCWEQKENIQTSGDKIHFLGFGHSGDYKLPVSQLSNNLSQITYASGAAMCINVKALETVGLLDRDLFMYHEDLDLCLRARFLGYDILLAPQSIVYHKYEEGISKNRWYWSERNRLITLLKFYKWKTLLIIFPLWLFMEVGVWAYSLFTGWIHLKFKSYVSVMVHLPKILIKRRKIQKSRKITDKQLSQYLEATFDFAGFTHPLLKYMVNPIFGIAWKILKKSILW